MEAWQQSKWALQYYFKYECQKEKNTSEKGLRPGGLSKYKPLLAGADLEMQIESITNQLIGSGMIGKNASPKVYFKVGSLPSC